MGSVANITADTFPKQGRHAGKRVKVCFHYDTSKTVLGGSYVTTWRAPVSPSSPCTTAGTYCRRNAIIRSMNRRLYWSIVPILNSEAGVKMSDGETVTCPNCKQVRYTKEPCVWCYGSQNPGRQTCSTCYSYRDRMCHRLEAEVCGWWNGCMLHCPKVLKLKGE